MLQDAFDSGEDDDRLTRRLETQSHGLQADGQQGTEATDVVGKATAKRKRGRPPKAAAQPHNVSLTPGASDVAVKRKQPSLAKRGPGRPKKGVPTDVQPAVTRSVVQSDGQPATQQSSSQSWHLPVRSAELLETPVGCTGPGRAAAQPAVKQLPVQITQGGLEQPPLAGQVEENSTAKKLEILGLTAATTAKKPGQADSESAGQALTPPSADQRPATALTAAAPPVRKSSSGVSDLTASADDVDTAAHSVPAPAPSSAVALQVTPAFKSATDRPTLTKARTLKRLHKREDNQPGKKQRVLTAKSDMAGCQVKCCSVHDAVSCSSCNSLSSGCRAEAQHLRISRHSLACCSCIAGMMQFRP